MTPREALDALLGLVDSMKCAGCDGRGVVSIARLDRFGEPIREDHACSMCCGDGADARAIAARPALETLAGCVVVSRESFDAFRATLKFIEGYWGECDDGDDEENSKYLKIVKPVEDRLRSAIAEAEDGLK